MFRYADDMVICCQYERDAQRIRKALGQRLAKYRLKLNEEKTRMVSFSKSRYRQGFKQGAFDFLGFTYYWSRTQKGYAVAKVQTSGKRMRSKLKNVGLWARKIRNQYPLEVIWRRFCSKLAGHIRYFGVSYNLKRVWSFCNQAVRILFKWLNRRSQRRSYSWAAFGRFLASHPLPPKKIYHRLF